MAIKTEERSRSLVCTFGEGDDALEFIIKPVNSRVGATLVTRLVGNVVSALTEDAALAGADDPERDIAELALGEHLQRASDELRAEEFSELFYAAFFWNAKGGGYSYVKRVEAGDYPKALEEFMQRVTLLGQTRQTIKSQS